MLFRYRIRQWANIVNLSTPLGMLIARAGRARLSSGPHGLLLGYGFRLPFPTSPAFTVGNVVFVRESPEWLNIRPALLGHEARHATQFAFCLGPVMVPFYLIAAGVSWCLCSDFATWNIFERMAGLDDGGYVPSPLRWR